MRSVAGVPWRVSNKINNRFAPRVGLGKKKWCRGLEETANALKRWSLGAGWEANSCKAIVFGSRTCCDFEISFKESQFKTLCLGNREPCVPLPVKPSRLMSVSVNTKEFIELTEFPSENGERVANPSLNHSSHPRPGVGKSIICSPVQFPPRDLAKVSQPNGNFELREKQRMSASKVQCGNNRFIYIPVFCSRVLLFAAVTARMLSTHLHFSYVSAGIDVFRPKLAAAMVAFVLQVTALLVRTFFS